MAEGGRGKKTKNNPLNRAKASRAHEKKGEEKHQKKSGPAFHSLFGSSEEDEEYETSGGGETNLGDLAVTLLKKKKGVDERVERRQSGPAVTLLDMAGHPKYMKSSINGKDNCTR